MLRRYLFYFFSCLVVLLGACSDKQAAEVDPVLWPKVTVEPPEAEFFSNRKWLLDFSSWSSTGCGQQQPSDPRHMGDFPLGNGHVFALMGYACPINTLHNMAGPDYQQEANFFHDTSMALYVGGHEQSEPVISGSVFRIRHTAIVVTREVMASLELITISFAPVGKSDHDPVNQALVRLAVVKNTSLEKVKQVSIKAEDATRTRNGRRRHLVVIEPNEQDAADVDLGDMLAGQERVIWYAYVTTMEGEDGQDIISAIRDEGMDGMLESTRDAWFSYMGEHTSVQCPDPRVEDLLDSVLVTIKTQQAYLGGVSPMSRYSLMWIRDTAGVVRLLLRVGMFEQARQMMDYYHMAVALRGDISNSVPLDLDPGFIPEEPEWDSMGPLSGRVRAESPSYLPLMAHWYTMATADGSLVDSQYGMLLRALDGQTISDDGLQSFGGDETFRPAMSVAFGRDIEYDWVGCCKSANSSFLYVAASEAMAQEASLRGDKIKAQELKDRADLVRTAAERTFWTEDGFYIPFVDEAVPMDRNTPFEDVSTKPLWTGYLSPNDERARKNLQEVIEIIGREDGFLQSWRDPAFADFMGLKIQKGIFTGMVPGYYLTNLAMTDHPEAQNAFNSLGLAASPSGNFSEDHIYDDYSILQLLYDASGTVSDMSARCRPWEGAVNLDAMVFYLTGLRQDAPDGEVHLAPRLPNYWQSMTWRNLRVGFTRFDMTVEDSGFQRVVTLDLKYGDPILVYLELPLGKIEVNRVQVDGRSLDADEYDIWSPFGLTRIRMAPVELRMTQPVVVKAKYQIAD